MCLPFEVPALETLSRLAFFVMCLKATVVTSSLLYAQGSSRYEV